MTTPSVTYDVLIVGGGHNGLVAATYLARAGLRVRVLERLGHTGGAAVSANAFSGIDARLSRYSYLVSLLPDRIVSDLGLRFASRSRPFGSCTPVRRDGRDTALLIEREPGAATAASFRELTGSDAEHRAWTGFRATTARFAAQVFPTFLEPLPSRGALRERFAGDASTWESLVERPLGETLEATFSDDAVRGVVLTDALIGTFTHAHDPSLRQNRCFLYHVVGNGTGEWRVPVGGMGALTDALAAAARDAGAELATGAEVVAIATDGERAEVTVREGDGEHVLAARHVLSNVAPAVLERLLGSPPGDPVEGSSVKVNMVLDRLPRLRAGVDTHDAFGGTFHIDEGYADSEAAYAAAARGELPERLPAEVYCHSLTDPSILAPELRARGAHTLTLFGVHAPARLFADDNDAARALVLERCLAGIDRHLAEPIEDCLARDADGRVCAEAKTPLDLEAELGLPGGHIFHRDLDWPFAGEDEDAGRWGVETRHPNVLVCGAGARRGGGVSGIGGHNAAMAVLEQRGLETPAA